MDEPISFKKTALSLFDNNQTGPLTNREIRNLKICSFPFLIHEDQSVADMALLVNRLIDTVEEYKGALHHCVKAIAELEKCKTNEEIIYQMTFGLESYLFGALDKGRSVLEEEK